MPLKLESIVTSLVLYPIWDSLKTELVSSGIASSNDPLTSDTVPVSLPKSKIFTPMIGC